MSDVKARPEFKWSVWDNSPAVSWVINGKTVSVLLSSPPTSISDLPTYSSIAIVGNYDDFGSANLLIYSYNGELKKTLVAPGLGSKPRFGSVDETRDGLIAEFGYFDEAGWNERAGNLNLEDGSIDKIHRNY